MSNKILMQKYKNIHSYNAYILYFFKKTWFLTKKLIFYAFMRLFMQKMPRGFRQPRGIFKTRVNSGHRGCGLKKIRKKGKTIC